MYTSQEENTIPDERLVKEVLNKDHDAFGVLIRRYEKLVVSIVFRMIGNQEEADLPEGRAEMSLQPDELLLNKEQNQRLWKLVDELPPVHQMMVSLFHRHELSMKEIAEISNLPEGTIKSYLHRARQKLKNKLLEK